MPKILNTDWVWISDDGHDLNELFNTETTEFNKTNRDLQEMEQGEKEIKEDTIDENSIEELKDQYDVANIENLFVVDAITQPASNSEFRPFEHDMDYDQRHVVQAEVRMRYEDENNNNITGPLPNILMSFFMPEPDNPSSAIQDDKLKNEDDQVVASNRTQDILQTARGQVVALQTLALKRCQLNEASFQMYMSNAEIRNHKRSMMLTKLRRRQSVYYMSNVLLVLAFSTMFSLLSGMLDGCLKSYLHTSNIRFHSKYEPSYVFYNQCNTKELDKTTTFKKNALQPEVAVLPNIETNTASLSSSFSSCLLPDNDGFLKHYNDMIAKEKALKLIVNKLNYDINEVRNEINGFFDLMDTFMYRLKVMNQARFVCRMREVAKLFNMDVVELANKPMVSLPYANRMKKLNSDNEGQHNQISKTSS